MPKLMIALVAAALAACALHHDARAAACGIPDTTPLWIDHAAHDAPIQPKPGLILAVGSGTEEPAAMRAAGAATVFFDLHLNDRVGTDSKPADPSLIAARADRLFDFAVSVTGCDTPIIAENELFGAQTTTPWSPSNAAYRANVLALLQELSARGARPFLTIANPPYVGGDAADWWRDAARAAVLVRQVFFNARDLWRLGPVAGSRMIRMRIRQTVAKLAGIGVPGSRIGIELVFVSAPGAGGREGLQPSSAWLDVVKWQALAAKQVASELHNLSSIWSWGWATYSTAGADPDKPAAACVYLWTRSPELCDGPLAAGASFDASLTEGQLTSLPSRDRCTLDAGEVTRAAVYTLTRLTHDEQLAATAALEQVVTRAADMLPEGAALRAERAVIADRFGGSRPAYLRALAGAGATLEVARDVLASELRRLDIADRLQHDAASPSAIQRFYDSYAGLPARLVTAAAAQPWLGQRTEGVAIASLAPDGALRVPAGRAHTLQTATGPVDLVDAGPVSQLGAFSLAAARPAIAAALDHYAAESAYEEWLVRRERRSLSTMLCRRDLPPAFGSVDLTAYLPFLAL
jgi:hypothetical protein